MANYFEMSRKELAAEKAKLEESYKEFQDMGLKLNMARGKPGPHQMDLAMGLLQMTDYTTDAGTDARNYGDLEGLHEARELFADVMGVKPEEAPGLRCPTASSSARCPAMTATLPSQRSLALS